LEKELAKAELVLGQEDTYQDQNKLAAANQHYQSVKTELEAYQADWESLAEQIMELE